ncbi:MAG TPA: choice-of-anchor tandem repeat GloVer-containing protein [Steroidobacteraceae bacterium]|nr:choice-of-anchor tandem repeat GloVer-containing protein [Steroidobacteraceae bacterium]
MNEALVENCQHHVTTLAQLPALAGGSATPSSLLWAADGNLYVGLLGSTSSVGVPGAVFRVTPAGVVTLLQRVGDSATAGAQGPRALVQSGDGSFYGTTFSDGVHGAGTLFRLTPAGTLTLLYAFTGKADGEAPNALTETLGRKPVLFGTTSGNVDPISGANSFATAGDFGTVFRWRGGAGFETLHRFSYQHDISPNFLVRTRSGLLYGTTAGDTSTADEHSVPNDAAGNLTTLHSFDSLYGTTLGLSGPGVPNISGTVFKLTLGGQITTLAQLDVEPMLQFQGRDGRFYGTTAGSVFQFSGQEAGTVFAMTAQGQISTLFDFGDGTSGVWPNRLIETQDGSIVATTLGIDSQFSGSADYGSVFRLTPDGAVNTLLHFDPVYPFDGGVLLSQPSALIEGFRGVVYGATLYGARLPQARSSKSKKAIPGLKRSFSIGGLRPHREIRRNRMQSSLQTHSPHCATPLSCIGRPTTRRCHVGRPPCHCRA